MAEKISVAMVGDLILDQPGPMEPYFEDITPVLQSIDIMGGHVETPHTNRTEPSCIDVQAPPSAPEHLDVLKGKFDVVSVAGNHAYDCGPNGVIDTIANLDRVGIPHCGTGANIYEAKKPVFITKNGIKTGYISYNLAGPSLGWAMSQKAGTNHVKVQTAYVPVRDMPAAPCKIYSWINPEDKEQLAEEIKELKSQCDVAVVFAHLGNGGDIPKLDQYEIEFTHHCIDCGADIVFGHHHHVLKGIDIYKGKPIYHGLGNFVTVTYAMTAGYNDTPEMIAYLKQRAKEGRGGGHYKVDFYPWSEKSRLTGIAKVLVDKDGNCENSFIPCYIEDSGKVVPKTRENGGQEVFDFVVAQSVGANLTAKFEWNEEGTEILVK